MRQWRRERKQDAERMARALLAAGVRVSALGPGHR